MSDNNQPTNDGPGYPLLKPLPADVIQHVSTYQDHLPHNLCGGIVGLNDGTLMFAYPDHVGLKHGDPITSEYRISADLGQTWGQPQTLDCKIEIWGMMRLKSGKLLAHGAKKLGDRPTFVSSSSDEGKTWTEPVDIGAYQDFYPYLGALSQSSSGRIILAGYWEGLNAGRPDEGLHEGATDTLPYTQYSWGLWRDRILFCGGHRGVEMGINIVYYSDDDGVTWQKCKGGIFGWFDGKGIPNGEGGIIDVYEPSVAETNDGRLLMLMRSKTGRLLQSYSLDQGVTWLSVLPTELSASQTTPQLIRIPGTGDLLCVWNQVSCEEIRRGFQRGRLSAAISRDSGLTWENFKTLELQEGMEDVDRISPEFPIARRVVGRAGLGKLPDRLIMFSQPVLEIVGEQVFIRYARMWPAEKELKENQRPSREWPDTWPRQEDSGATFREHNILRIYPLKWFYK